MAGKVGEGETPLGGLIDRPHVRERKRGGEPHHKPVVEVSHKKVEVMKTDHGIVVEVATKKNPIIQIEDKPVGPPKQHEIHNYLLSILAGRSFTAATNIGFVVVVGIMILLIIILIIYWCRNGCGRASLATRFVLLQERVNCNMEANTRLISQLHSMMQPTLPPDVAGTFPRRSGRRPDDSSANTGVRPKDPAPRGPPILKVPPKEFSRFEGQGHPLEDVKARNDEVPMERLLIDC